MTGRRAGVVLLATLPIGSALAQTATAAAPVASPVFGLLQGLFGLVVVVALIFAAAWLVKKIGPRARGNSIVQVLGGASVGPREKVVVVRFEGRTLLLGVAPGHVGLLHADDSPEGPQVESPPAAGPSFIDRLRAARGTS